VDDSKVALMNWSVAKAATQAPTVSDADLPKDGEGDPSLTYDVVRKNPAAFRGKRVTWAFMSSSAKGNRILGALDRDAAVPPPHHGLYVVEFAADKDVGRIFGETAFAKGASVTATVAGEVDQFLVVRDKSVPVPKDIPQVKVPLLVHPTVNFGNGAPAKTPETKPMVPDKSAPPAKIEPPAGPEGINPFAGPLTARAKKIQAALKLCGRSCLDASVTFKEAEELDG
jgi:hypothetical protein